MNNLDKLAKMFKERENSTLITATVGKVIGTGPVRVQYGSKIILTEHKNLFIAESVKAGYRRDVEINRPEQTNITGDMEYKSGLISGDTVILIPDNSLKNWYLIDKVVLK